MIKIPLWASLKAADCASIPIANLLWILPQDRPPLQNPVTIHSLSIWNAVKYSGGGGLQSPHLSLMSFLGNPAFLPGWENPRAFRQWLGLKLTDLYCLVMSHGPKSFHTSQVDNNLPRAELFNYLQVKYFIQSMIIVSDKGTKLTLLQRSALPGFDLLALLPTYCWLFTTLLHLHTEVGSRS